MTAVSAFDWIVNKISQNFPIRLFLGYSLVIELVSTILQLLARHTHFSPTISHNTRETLSHDLWTTISRFGTWLSVQTETVSVWEKQIGRAAVERSNCTPLERRISSLLSVSGRETKRYLGSSKFYVYRSSSSSGKRQDMSDTRRLMAHWLTANYQLKLIPTDIVSYQSIS